jgi:hypothetical protein
MDFNGLFYREIKNREIILLRNGDLEWQFHSMKYH